MASCCETEESLNGRMRRISEAHKQTVTAGESKTIPRITEERKMGSIKMKQGYKLSCKEINNIKKKEEWFHPIGQ